MLQASRASRYSSILHRDFDVLMLQNLDCYSSSHQWAVDLAFYTEEGDGPKLASPAPLERSNPLPSAKVSLSKLRLFFGDLWWYPGYPSEQSRTFLKDRMFNPLGPFSILAESLAMLVLLCWSYMTVMADPLVGHNLPGAALNAHHYTSLANVFRCALVGNLTSHWYFHSVNNCNVNLYGLAMN